MDRAILFRVSDLESTRELEIASKYFPVYKNRVAIPKNSLVIPRYSSLPYYRELEKDLEFNESKLINSYRQFQYIANFDYYEDVRHLTFPTWFSFGDIPPLENGPFVLKGRTNSKKREWKRLMYAKDRVAAIGVMSELLKDDMISTQGVIFRKYEELEKLGESEINGQIFANEWRFFCYKNKILSKGYYWSIASPETIKSATIDKKGLDFAQQCAIIIGNKTNFFVIDIARKQNGDWVLVEVNDGGCSGLDLEYCDETYKNLKSALSD